MKLLNKNPLFKTLILITLLYLVSCSKDDETPVKENQETKVTITTTDFTTIIDENPTNGQVIGQVQASTNTGSITFSITEQTPDNSFNIDDTSGKLTVADTTVFDFETYPQITGTVQVVNGDVSENAEVKINLNDLKEGKIFDGNAFLTTQKEVETFGANQYTDITGNLRIGYSSTPDEYTDIDDLSSLSSISSVGANFIVGYNDKLETLNGLENITSIKDRIVIEENPALKTIESLQNLRDLYSSISILKNNSLQNLDGLDTIEHAVIVNIIENASLTNIDGLSQLSKVYEIRIEENESLFNINGLNGLIESYGYVSVSYNKLLKNIDGLSNIKIVESLTINGNDAITNIDGIENIEVFSDQLTIRKNAALTNISAVGNIPSPQSIYLEDNPLLTNLHGLEKISSLNFLKIINLGITNVEELKGLVTVALLKISENSNLTSLAGISNVETVSGALIISDNDVLENLNGLNLLAADEIRITENPILKNLDGFSNLITIGDDLRIRSNNSLTDFCGLQTLFLNNGLRGSYHVYGNAYNPTQQDIIDGNCSL